MNVLTFIAGCVVGGVIVSFALAIAYAVCAINGIMRKEEENANIKTE